MSDTLNARISELEGQIAFLDGQFMALQSLFFAQAAVLNKHFEGSAQATADDADLKRRAALRNGDRAWADSLEALIDLMRERFALPTND